MKPKKFLPSENIIYKTSLKQEEVLKRLENILEAEKMIRFRIFSKRSSKPYEGYLYGNEFSMSRIISYRNSFLPTINGLVKKELDGTSIKVKMRLPVFAIVFLSIWYGALVLAFIVLIVQTLNKEGFNPVMLVPLGMMIFAYLLTMGAFKFESSKTKNYLKNLLEAEIIEE